MKNPHEIRELADKRLKEAKLLLTENHCEGALYLAGYCIELLLKAKIAELLDVQNLFDDSFSPKQFRTPFYIHDLKSLLIFAGLKTKLDKEKAINPLLYNNWSLIEETWNEHCRYQKSGTYKEKDVEKFIITIEDPTKGIKQWINRQS